MSRITLLPRGPMRGIAAAAAAAALLTGMVATPVGAAPVSAVTIAGEVPGLVAQSTDLGPAAATDTITVTVWLSLHNEAKLAQLVKDQQTKGNANYHKWLTAADVNAQFSPTAQEVKAVSNYLRAKGLTVGATAENNVYVTASGTIAQVQQAFKVAIHNFNYHGKVYRANTGNPSVSSATGARIAAISGLDDYGYHSDLAVAGGGTPSMTPLAAGSNGAFFAAQCLYGHESQTFVAGSVSAKYSGQRYGADIANTALGQLAPCGYSPAEMRQAYGLPDVTSGTVPSEGDSLGTGQTIVITDAFGSPTIQQDLAAFDGDMNLPAADLTVYQAPGADNTGPGRCAKFDCAGWASETTLDVEWAHAMAPGAKIALVIAGSPNADLDQAINWAVLHHLGNVISNSWSMLEGLGNPATYDRMNRILMTAAAQGVDVNFSSGDSGDESINVGFKTVDFPASSPYATGVGGTSLFLDEDQNGVVSNVQQTAWGTNLTKIADVAPGNAPSDPPQNLGFQYGAGGGASLTYAKPSWQTGTGTGSMRMVPDVSMLADPYTGAEIIQTVGGQLSFGSIGGTSLAAPMFSGVMAIATQKAGHALGQAAPLLYSLDSLAPGAVTDVTQLAGADNVTGTVTDAVGTTSYSADRLANPAKGSPYISAFYNSPYSTRWFVITFGTDSSLAAGTGWDAATGVGTPNGWSFVKTLGQ